MYNPLDPDRLKWKGKPVAFTDHAKRELWFYDLTVDEVIEMLNTSFECKKQRKFKENEEEVCARKHKKIYRIIIFEDYCRDYQMDCYVIKHVSLA